MYILRNENALHVRYNELKELANACQTVAEVENIVWGVIK